MPADLVDEAIERVDAGHASSLSAYVTDALRRRVLDDGERDAYLEWLRKLDDELGPPGPEAYAWAREVLGL